LFDSGVPINFNANSGTFGREVLTARCFFFFFIYLFVFIFRQGSVGGGGGMISGGAGGGFFPVPPSYSFSYWGGDWDKGGGPPHSREGGSESSTTKKGPTFFGDRHRLGFGQPGFPKTEGVGPRFRFYFQGWDDFFFWARGVLRNGSPMYHSQGKNTSFDVRPLAVAGAGYMCRRLSLRASAKPPANKNGGWPSGNASGPIHPGGRFWGSSGGIGAKKGKGGRAQFLSGKPNLGARFGRFRWPHYFSKKTSSQ